ncbi:TPA: PTS sugar transporter subunit IIA [Streptococcus suis]|nr:PTS fructose transporter subunit IIA [Streptococcus parasuis]
MGEILDSINISDMISEEIITLDLKATTKLGAIEELSELLLNRGDITNKQAFVDDVLLRETEGVTGIGQQLAIPHGKSDTVINTTIAIGISDHDIEWESLDEQPVRIIFLFAVRDQDSSTVHLKLLQKVAILLADDELINKIQTIKSKQALLDLLDK